MMRIMGGSLGNTAQSTPDDFAQNLLAFFVILHRNSLTYGSMPAKFLYNLKKLTSHLSHKLCAVLP